MEYWERRYKGGGTSGLGSIGENARWRWRILEKYIKNIDNVIDIGCGDLSFWTGRDCNSYVGIDFSPFIVAQNKKRRPHWRFIQCPAQNFIANMNGKIILCLDILFHILNENDYRAVLKNLMLYSTDYIFIYTWIRNPFYSWKKRYYFLKKRQFRKLIFSLAHKLTTDNRYIAYRDFRSYISMFRNMHFRLIGIEKNHSIDKFGAMFIFRKES